MFRKEIVRGCISISAGVLIWEILARALLENELLIPPPSSVLRSFWTLAAKGQLNKHFEATLIEFDYGFSTACILGILIRYFMGMYRWFKEGTYQGKKVPPMSDYVDSSYMEEALKLAGGK